MGTRELLEKVMIRSMGQRDLRLGASHIFSKSIEMMAGKLEWWVRGGGDDMEGAAAAAVIEAEPKVKRKVMSMIKDMRSLARDIKHVDPSLSAIDIKPGLVRAEADAPAFGWWKPQEIQDALVQAYWKAHSMKGDFDRMEEIPSYLSASYKAVMKTLSGIDMAQKGAQDLYNQLRHARRKVR